MKQLRTLLVAVFFVFVGSALAQPANDSFANRFTLNGLLVITNGTTVGATQEAGEPDITGFGGNNDGNQTAWYQWVAPASAPTVLRAGGNNYRALIGAYTGTAVNGLTTVATAQAPNNQTNATITFTPSAGTSYKIKVDRRQPGNAGTFSLVVSQAVSGPLISLTSPANGLSVTNPANVTLNATVSTPLGGTVTNVSFFYQATNLIASFTSSPYTFIWANPPAGSYPVSARATDDSGRVGNSGAANINVRSPGYFLASLVTTGSIWKYLDNGTDQGSAWTATGFDDSAWASGPAELGYGDETDNPPRPAATTVGFGPDPQNKYVTIYFRHAFVVSNATSLNNLIVRLLRDDGAVVWLNGTPVWVNNFPAGTTTIDYQTLAANAADDGVTYFTANVPAAGLVVQGTNVLAVEIHQGALNSSDLSFDFALDVEGAGAPPTVAITSPTNNAPFFAPANIFVTSTASDIDGTVTNVDFFVDGVKLAQRTTVPYNFIWSSPAVGAHVVRVEATDDGGGTGAAQIDVVVYNSVGTPVAQITSPANDAVFDGPTNLTITATAHSTNTVTNLQFIANGSVVIGNDATSPYSAVWNNAAFGTNLLTAIVTDAQNRRGTSPPVRVVVIAPPPNLHAPFVSSRTPAAGANVGALTSIQVTFSESVVGVGAADLLVNGQPATGVTGTGSNYTFTVDQPNYGAISITWAVGHGIEDIGFPPLAFNGAASSNIWNFTLSDLQAPTIAAQVPVAGAVVTNLSSIQVTFSENVQGVNAGDLLVNGTPASGITVNSPLNYTFSFAQPAQGGVNISWAGGHGITDTSPSLNGFNAAGGGANWSYTLTVPATVLIPSNTVWRFIPGTSEASNPIQ
ncbi:MAG TPA: Ig-like domain-containing protein, partial [Methylomirabilota bacterium]|nr:Ig-like domain-containing protein [Methylomirabilota bacterium]